MCLENPNNFLVLYNDVSPSLKTSLFKWISSFGPNSKEYLPPGQGWHRPTGISVILITSRRQTETRLRPAIYRNTWYDAICSRVWFTTEAQRTSSLRRGLAVHVSVDPATTNGLETLKTELLHHLLSVPAAHRKLKLLGKQASSVGKPKPACEPQGGFSVTQRVVWWRSVVSPFTPESTSHSTGRGVGGVSRAENLPSACWTKVLPVL